MKYLAIDPGKTTGWASFDEEGRVTAFEEVTGEDKFLDWLEEQSPEVVIIEQYRNRGGLVNSFSTMPTSQHIGAITRILRKKKSVIVFQEPSPALSQGLRFLGMYTTYRNQHVPDKVSALAHGTYYLRKNGLQK